MYRLYWRPDTAARAPHIALEEIGAEYVLSEVEVADGKLRDPDYLKLNPTGKVPTLVVAEKQVVTESAAIVMYLADRHPAAELAPSTTEPARGDYYRWLAFMTNTLQPAFMRYYYPARHAGEGGNAEAVKAKATQDVGEAWDVIERHLEGQDYLLGITCRACDLFLFMLSGWRTPTPDFETRWPNVTRTASLVGAREAVKRVVARDAAG